MPPRAYVYYRVGAVDRDVCVNAVQELQAGWRKRWPSLHAELLQRPEVDERGCVTLMEVYEAPALDEVWPAMQDEAGQQLSRWIEGRRHVERFERCA